MSAASISYMRHRFPPEIITYAVWLYCRFNLSFREVEEMFLNRGVDVSYETIRRWVTKLGPVIARGLRASNLNSVISGILMGCRNDPLRHPKLLLNSCPSPLRMPQGCGSAICDPTPPRVAAFRRSSREIVDAARPILQAIPQSPGPCARCKAISSRSENVRYRPDRGGAYFENFEGAMPPSLPKPATANRGRRASLDSRFFAGKIFSIKSQSTMNWSC